MTVSLALYLLSYAFGGYFRMYSFYLLNKYAVTQYDILYQQQPVYHIFKVLDWISGGFV